MRKTLGHWFLDIAKYLLTAGVIAPFIGKGLQWYGILIVVLAVAALLIIGLQLVKDDETKIKTKKGRK